MLKRSAISIVPRLDGKLLVVWNRQHQGWAFPGGKVEEGEEPDQTQRRELREETSLETVFASRLYTAPSSIDRCSRCHAFANSLGVYETCWFNGPLHDWTARMVTVFLVAAVGEPREVEAGCPVCWMTLDELLAVSPFRDFYKKMLISCGVLHAAVEREAAVLPDVRAASADPSTREAGAVHHGAGSGRGRAEGGARGATGGREGDAARSGGEVDRLLVQDCPHSAQDWFIRNGKLRCRECEAS